VTLASLPRNPNGPCGKLVNSPLAACVRPEALPADRPCPPQHAGIFQLFKVASWVIDEALLPLSYSSKALT
jgi:hypothetical protein